MPVLAHPSRGVYNSSDRAGPESPGTHPGADRAVVIDGNHPWARQTLELEVKLLGFLEAPLGQEVANDETL